MTATIEKIVEEISGLNVMDLCKLRDVLEEKWGVKASSGGGMMMAMPVAAPAAAVEEKTSFDVVLSGFDSAKKLGVIKEVRSVNSSLSLPDAKNLVEKSESEGQVIASGVNKDKAEEIKKTLEASGAKVKLV